MRDLQRLLAGVALIVAASATDAQAATTTFNDLGDFLSAAASASIPLSLDTLDFLADAGPFTTITRPDYSVTDNDPPASMDQSNFSAFCNGGAQPTTGCITITMGANGATFSFGSAINAFGLMVSKSTLATVPTLTLNGNTITGDYDPNGAESIEIGFFGLIDDTTAFSDVALAGVSAGNLLGFDDVRYGAVEETPPSGGAVPEPTALGLLLGGASGLWAVARRRARV
jgi:hypothetical protein